MAQNDNVNTLFHNNEHKPDKKNSADYMTRGFSIGRKSHRHWMPFSRKIPGMVCLRSTGTGEGEDH